MRFQTGPAIVTFLLLISALLLVGCFGSTDEDPKPAIFPAVLKIDAPPQIAAGTPLTITVRSLPLLATEPILLVAQGSFGSYPQITTAISGTASYQLTHEQTRYAGTVELIASSGGAESRSSLEILPGEAVDPVLPLVGPRSIVADGTHWTMVVTTARDRYLNPIAEGSAVTLHVQHPVKPGDDPASATEVIDTQMSHLLSWKRIYSRTLAGETLLSASSGNAHSPERSFLEVPGIPVPFSLSADRLILSADGRQLVRIRSDLIKDRFGNLLLDGASVTVLATMGTGEQRRLPNQLLNGRIDLMLQAPNHPGEMTVQAWIVGVSSRPLPIEFTAGPTTQPIKIKVIFQEEGIKLVMGPLIGALNQFIPDGSEVTVRIADPAGTHMETVALADYGYAELFLRRSTLASGIYEVTVQAGTGTGTASFELP